jgi:hypothetical protein
VETHEKSVAIRAMLRYFGNCEIGSTTFDVLSYTPDGCETRPAQLSFRDLCSERNLDVHKLALCSEDDVAKIATFVSAQVSARIQSVYFAVESRGGLRVYVAKEGSVALALIDVSAEYSFIGKEACIFVRRVDFDPATHRQYRDAEDMDE